MPSLNVNLQYMIGQFAAAWISLFYQLGGFCDTIDWLESVVDQRQLRGVDNSSICLQQEKETLNKDSFVAQKDDNVSENISVNM